MEVFRNKDLAPQMAMKMGLGQLRGSSLADHLFTAPNQIPIIASGGIDVCDCAHRVFVMKKGRGLGVGKNPKRDRAVASRLWKAPKVGRGYAPFVCPSGLAWCVATTNSIERHWTAAESERSISPICDRASKLADPAEGQPTIEFRYRFY